MGASARAFTRDATEVRRGMDGNAPAAGQGEQRSPT